MKEAIRCLIFLVCLLVYRPLLGMEIPGPVTEIRDCNGIPTVFVDGRPSLRPFFETYVPQEKYFKAFADAGCQVHTFSLSLGPCMQIAGGRANPIWIGPDQWDFAQLDARAHEALKGDPDGYLMPRFYIDTPDWWLSHNVDQCMVLDTGKNYYVAPTENAVTTNHLFASLASEKWRQDMSWGIKRIIEHMLASDYGDRIFGYQITGLYTEEWYHWSSNANQLADYSEPFRQGFAAWLQKKYPTVEALRWAWNDPGLDFAKVTVPAKAWRMKDVRQRTFRVPQADMPVIDFYLYYSEVMAEVIECFCRAAKEATGGKKIVGSFYGFMFEFMGNPEFGHNALRRFNASKDIDFIVVTASYWNRLLGPGADYPRSPATSVKLHHKMWYHDNDTLSFLYKKIMGVSSMSLPEQIANVEREADRIGAPKTLPDTLWQYERTAGFTLGWGLQSSFFDLHGGYFDHPDLMKKVADLTKILTDAVQYDRNSLSEILVVSDEVSCSYCTYQSDMLAKSLFLAQPIFFKMGAPYDSILVDDLSLVDMNRYKMVIFLNDYHLTEAQRKLIRDKVLNNGRVVLWCYVAGLFNGHQTSLAAMNDLMGIKMVRAKDASLVKPRIVVVPSPHALSAVLLKAGIKETGSDGQNAEMFSVNDPQAVILGVLPGTQDITLAIKKVGDWTSAYTITSVMAPEIYRELARLAGVHVYSEKNDTLYVSKSYLTLNADGAGSRTLSFPSPCDVFNPLTGEKLYEKVQKVTRDFQDKETWLIRYETR